MSKEPLTSNEQAESPVKSPQPKRSQRWAWFWRTFLVVSIAAAWYCFYVPANSIAWASDFTTAQQQAIETDKPIILFFTGDWCVPCKIMKREVWADDDVSSLVNAEFIPVLINIDSPQDADVPERYKVRGTPITIVTDPKGNALGWRVGGIDKAEFLQLLKNQDPPTANN
ncbi:MAG: thioredoxin family protein [Pirellulaceae bacterium]